MKTHPECRTCFLRQAKNASELANLNPRRTESLLVRIADELDAMPTGDTPPVRASRVHALIRRESGDADPYRSAKSAATRQALALYPQLKTLIAESEQPLETAIRLAIAGNIIDLGVAAQYDLVGSIDRVLHQSFAIDHLDRLTTAIERTGSILYLADNAGETVLDRLLIETLGKPVTYVVKGGPAVNDATLDDALEAGLSEVCDIIDNGAAILGTLLDQCSKELRQRFDQADLIIAKGMANYESLSGTRGDLFFLLQAKCPVIAEHLGVSEKSIVVMENQPA